MANPNFPLDGQGDTIDALVNAAGTVFLKYGVGSVAVAGATNASAWHGVATHVDGATAATNDGVALIAGESGTTVKHVLVDSAGNLIVVGGGASGSAVVGSPVRIAGSDGANTRDLLTDTRGVPYANAPQNVTVLASAARTTTQTQADQTNSGAYRGITVILDMTAVGTGSVTLEIDGKDPASGKYVALLTGAAVTTNVTNVYRVYPTITAAANSIAQDTLWATWRIKVTANNANSATYSVGAILVP